MKTATDFLKILCLDLALALTGIGIIIAIGFFYHHAFTGTCMEPEEYFVDVKSSRSKFGYRVKRRVKYKRAPLSPESIAVHRTIARYHALSIIIIFSIAMAAKAF